MKSLFAAVLAATLMALLSGCAVYTPAPAAVVVDPGPGSGFCPPGQAKKGRC
jgi:hypothetical protein